MRLCLGMMIGNDTAYLPLHLPVYASRFDGMVVVCEPHSRLSGKSIGYFADLSVHSDIFPHKFNGNWSETLNQLIEHAEALGYDAMIRLDPDECVFPNTIDTVRLLLETHGVVCLPRINFWKDRKHQGWYDNNPDHQARCFRLNEGRRYVGAHHEQMFGLPNEPRYYVDAPFIYHYGWIGKQRMLDKDFHYLNVAREAEGLPPLAERPADREAPSIPYIEYNGPQPLDPDVVGATAPFEE